MQEIVWLSHGGPGSGRYPKGSGEKNKKKQVKRSRKEHKYSQNMSKKYNEIIKTLRRKLMRASIENKVVIELMKNGLNPEDVLWDEYGNIYLINE